jgi:hypothetical protein
MLSIENTWKHTVFFKCMEKIVFPTRIKFLKILNKMKIQFPGRCEVHLEA